MGAIPACNCNKKPGEEEITFPDKDSKDIEKVILMNITKIAQKKQYLLKKKLMKC